MSRVGHGARRGGLGVAAAAAGLVLLVASPAAAHPASQPLPRPTPLGVLLDWHLDPTIVVPLVVAGWLYLVGVRRCRRTGRPWPRRRTAMFLTGLVVLEVALQSAIDTYDTSMFSVHAVQHMLLSTVAAPLLVLGAPVTLLLLASPPGPRRRVIRFVHSRPVKVLTHPILGWMLFTFTLYGLYFSPLFDLSLRNEAVHKLVHLHFIVAGLLFWWPVAGLDPSRWRLHHALRIMYVFLMVPFHAFLGVAILNSKALLAPELARFDRPWGMAPLPDQQVGGAVMWGIGEIVTFTALLGILVSWANQDAKEAKRIDRQLARARAAGHQPPATPSTPEVTEVSRRTATPGPPTDRPGSGANRRHAAGGPR